MAGERKGKTYETIVALVLEEVVSELKWHKHVFWNQKPVLIHTEPDFTIGATKDAPDVVVMVTHGSSAKESNRKYWRNVGELFEAKVLLSKPPRVVSVVFDALIKPDIKLLEISTFDNTLIVGDRTYGRAIQTWVDKNASRLGNSNAARLEKLRELRLTDNALVRLLASLKTDFAALLSGNNIKQDSLWGALRRRKVPVDQLARKTSFNRGINKILIFEDIELALSLYRGERVDPSLVPDYCFHLGLAKRAIGRVVPADDDVRSALELLDDKTLRKIVRMAPIDRISAWLLALRQASHLQFIGEFVARNIDSICDEKILSAWLVGLHCDPWALVNKKQTPDKWPPGHVWLLEYLIELIRESTGTATGYGYATLAKDVIEQGFGSDDDLSNAGQFGGGLGLSAWLARNSKTTLRSDLVRGIAVALSKQFSSIAPDTITKLLKTMPKCVVKSTLNRLYTKGFEPLAALVPLSIPGCQSATLQSCFAQAAGMDGRSGKSRALRKGKTLIKWQSVTDSGRHHKRKELCGRVVSLRFEWSSKANRFVEREEIRKYVLVVDGTWTQDDLRGMIRAGWDEIFYPDEMDKLAKAIV